MTESSSVAKTSSLRGFARLVRVNEAAVRKAIANGRLEVSVGRDARGRPQIVDVTLALEEWSANCDASKVRA
jgi:hypothetical protein